MFGSSRDENEQEGRRSTSFPPCRGGGEHTQSRMASGSPGPHPVLHPTAASHPVSHLTSHRCIPSHTPSHIPALLGRSWELPHPGICRQRGPWEGFTYFVSSSLSFSVSCLSSSLSPSFSFSFSFSSFSSWLLRGICCCCCKTRHIKQNKLSVQGQTHGSTWANPNNCGQTTPGGSGQEENVLWGAHPQQG